MKTKYGYQASECRPTNGTRHIYVEIATIRPFDIGAALLCAAKREDTRRIENLTKLAKAANGRTVYTQDSTATVCYQGSQDFSHWYSPNLHLNGWSTDKTACRNVFKAFDRSEVGALTPKMLIESLGAVRLEMLLDEAGESIRAGCEYARVECKEADTLLNDPYPKVEELAA